MRLFTAFILFWGLFFVTSSATPTIYPAHTFLSLFRGEAELDNGLEHFWEQAQIYGSKAGEVVLDAAIKAVSGAKNTINDFRGAMEDVITDTRNIRIELETFLEEKNLTLSYLSDGLYEEIAIAYKQLQDEGVDPLPEERSERSKARALLVERVLLKVEKAYIQAIVKLGIPRERGEEHMRMVLPKIKRVLLVTGDLIDDHPILLKSVIFAASMLLLPEIQILRPVMSLFGFGPLGPVKGSAAAWLQSRFWGGFVESGSWFSFLQKVGMTLTGSWIQRIIASLGLAATFGLVAKKTAGLCS